MTEKNIRELKRLERTISIKVIIIRIIMIMSHMNISRVKPFNV